MKEIRAVKILTISCIALLLSTGCQSTPTMRESFEQNRDPNCESCKKSFCEYEKGETEPVCDDPALEDFANKWVEGCKKLKEEGSCPIFEEECPDSQTGNTISQISIKDIHRESSNVASCPVTSNDFTVDVIF